MLKNIEKALLLAGMLAAASNVNAASLSYGWEDGVGTVLGEFGSQDMSYSNYSGFAHTGNNALLIEDNDTATTGTPQGYVAMVTGLTDGDTVDASFWAFDTSNSGAPSARIWGHYTNGGDINGYNGSAGGNDTYSGATDWSELTHSWVFDSDGGARDGLIIEARFYDSSSVTTGSIVIDDLTINTSAGSIVSPAVSAVPVPAAVWLFASGLLGMVGIARRRA